MSKPEDSSTSCEKKVYNSIKEHPEEEEAIEHVYDVIVMCNELLATVTHHPDAVTRWINALNKHTTGVRRIGFELEVDKQANRIGTLQLLVGTRCLIFQLPPDAPLPTSLDEFLASPNNCFVGVDVTAQMNRLRRQCPFEASTVNCDNLFPCLQEHVEMTGWVRPRLSHVHVLHACTNVFMKTFGKLSTI